MGELRGLHQVPDAHAGQSKFPELKRRGVQDLLPALRLVGLRMTHVPKSPKLTLDIWMIFVILTSG